MNYFARNRLRSARLVVIFIFFVFSLVVTVSLGAFGIFSISLADNDPALGSPSYRHGLDNITFGVWTYCVKRHDSSVNVCDFVGPCDFKGGGLTQCSGYHFGYDVEILPAFVDQPEGEGVVHVGSTWTRAVPVHAACTIFLVILFFVSWKAKPGIFLAVCFLVLYMACLIIDISFMSATRARFAYSLGGVPHKLKVGVGFWITLVTLCYSFVEVAIAVIEHCCCRHLRLAIEELERRQRLQQEAMIVPPPSPPRPIPMAAFSDSFPAMTVYELPQRTSAFSQSSAGSRSQIGAVTHGTIEAIREPAEGSDSEAQRSRTEQVYESEHPHPAISRDPTDGSAGVFQCPICLDEGDEVQHVSSLKCGHTFCTKCAATMVRETSRCAICRQTAQQSDLRRVYLSGPRM